MDPEEILITKEDGRGLCDIAIEKSIGIELKKDLNSKSKVDRLIGQVNSYKREYKDILIVLVGTTGDEALTYLKRQLRSITNNSPITLGYNEGVIKIIVKKNVNNRRSKSAARKAANPFGFNIEPPKFF